MNTFFTYLTFEPLLMPNFFFSIESLLMLNKLQWTIAFLNYPFSLAMNNSLHWHFKVVQSISNYFKATKKVAIG